MHIRTSRRKGGHTFRAGFVQVYEALSNEVVSLPQIQKLEVREKVFSSIFIQHRAGNNLEREFSSQRQPHLSFSFFLNIRLMQTLPNPLLFFFFAVCSCAALRSSSQCQFKAASPLGWSPPGSKLRSFVFPSAPSPLCANLRPPVRGEGEEILFSSSAQA